MPRFTLPTARRREKILYSGLSDFPAWRVATAATLAELRGWAPISAVQLEYSLVERTAERELLPMAAAFNLGRGCLVTSRRRPIDRQIPQRRNRPRSRPRSCDSQRERRTQNRNGWMKFWRCHRIPASPPDRSRLPGFWSKARFRLSDPAPWNSLPTTWPLQRSSWRPSKFRDWIPPVRSPWVSLTTWWQQAQRR